MVFVDVVGAFDAVLRSEVFDPGADLERLGVPKALADQARASHRETWLCTEGLDNTVHTKRGVRPSDAYGSLVFNILMEKQNSRRKTSTCP